MRFTVTAPEAGYAGSVGAVQFADGVAVIDEDSNPSELAYCRAAGYTVEEVDEPKPRSATTRRAPVQKGTDQ